MLLSSFGLALTTFCGLLGHASLSMVRRFHYLATTQPEKPFLLSHEKDESSHWSYGFTAGLAHEIGSLICEADARATASHAVRTVALFGKRTRFSYASVLGAWLSPCAQGRRLAVAPVNPRATSVELNRTFTLLQPIVLALTQLDKYHQAAVCRLFHNFNIRSILAVVKLEGPDLDCIPASIQRAPLLWQRQHGSSFESRFIHQWRRDVAGGNHLQERIEEDEPALVLFTSGSTGLPKAVIVAHRQIRHGTDLLLHQGFGITPDFPANADSCKSRTQQHVVAAAVSCHWDVAWYDFGMALSLPGGAPLLVLPENIAWDSDYFEYITALRTHNVTILSEEPAALKNIIDAAFPSHGLQQLLQKADTDDNGIVTPWELQSCYRQARATFHAADIDENDLGSILELMDNNDFTYDDLLNLLAEFKMDRNVGNDEDEDGRKLQEFAGAQILETPLPLLWLISTGSPFPLALGRYIGELRRRSQAVIADDLKVIDCYGGTEFSNIAHRVLPLRALLAESEWPPFPFDNNTMVLRRSESNGDSIMGDLVLHGDGLMISYLTSDLQQFGKELKKVDEHATGDMVRVKDNGFEVLGRADRRVVIQGDQVHLDQTEALFEQCEAVTTAAALPYVEPYEPFGLGEANGLHILIELSPSVSRKLAEDIIRNHTQAMFGEFLSFWFHWDKKIPRTTTGKKDLKALRKIGQELDVQVFECSEGCPSKCEAECTASQSLQECQLTCIEACPLRCGALQVGHSQWK